MSGTYTVGVVGATGMVGRTMLRVLEEREFPVGRCVAIASERSRGQKVQFRDQQIDVQAADPALFEDIDIALFSAGGDLSKLMAPRAAERGAVVIDNSSAWRMDPGVPLVVPEVNPHAIQRHNGIIANPNCSTIQMVVALQPLHKAFQIKRIVVSTYQAVSGSGKRGIDQLTAELAGQEPAQPYYPHRIAMNCLPQVDVFFDDGYTREEHKMVNETRKIMEDERIRISATCVRVPVHTSHSESVNVEFTHPVDLEQVRQLLTDAPGVVLEDEPSAGRYPLALKARGNDAVYVGRLRRDPSVEHGLNMWIVSDNLRKGAATNAVQIAEHLIASKPVADGR